MLKLFCAKIRFFPIFVYLKTKTHVPRTANPGSHQGSDEGEGRGGPERQPRHQRRNPPLQDRRRRREGGHRRRHRLRIYHLCRICREKLVKQRKEAAEQFVAGGRQDLADNELAEAAALEKYLPKQLSPDEVKAKIQEIIAQVGASSIRDMGKVMGVANKALAGLSDGRTISGIVKELLSQA